MTQPFISIIIPIYNVERFLNDALESVFVQSIHVWDAICVVDGSPDRSGEIAETFIRQDVRFKIIYQRNAGVSSARNRGMKHSDGEYTVFMDADDAIDRDYFKVMQDINNKYSPDLISLSNSWVSEDFDYKAMRVVARNQPTVMRGVMQCMLRFWSTARHINTGVWKAGWRTSCLSGIVFHSDLKTGEDAIFAWEVYPKIKSLVEYDYPGYFYRTNFNSCLHTPHFKTAMKAWYARVRVILDFYKTENTTLRYIPLWGFSRYLIVLVIAQIRHINVVVWESARLKAYVCADVKPWFWACEAFLRKALLSIWGGVFYLLYKVKQQD